MSFVTLWCLPEGNVLESTRDRDDSHDDELSLQRQDEFETVTVAEGRPSTVFT